MSHNSHWPGKVENRSTSPVWILWDDGDKWFGKPLAAGRRSPKGLDVDGVCPYYDGMKIAELDKKGKVVHAVNDWWWLNRGAEVVIKDGYGMQTIEVTSLIGKLSVVKDTDVSGWGVFWEIDVDASWGIQL